MNDEYADDPTMSSLFNVIKTSFNLKLRCEDEWKAAGVIALGISNKAIECFSESQF